MGSCTTHSVICKNSIHTKILDILFSEASLNVCTVMHRSTSVKEVLRLTKLTMLLEVIHLDASKWLALMVDLKYRTPKRNDRYMTYKDDMDILHSTLLIHLARHYNTRHTFLSMFGRRNTL